MKVQVTLKTLWQTSTTTCLVHYNVHSWDYSNDIFPNTKQAKEITNKINTKFHDKWL